MDTQPNRSERLSQHRAVVFTSLPVEYMAVRVHLDDLKEEVSQAGTVYERGRLTGETTTWDVMLVEIDMGSTDSALQAQRAIDHFQPAVVLSVGVATGHGDLQVGDVVASSKVYGVLDRGDRFEDSLTFTSSYPLEQRARAEVKKTAWLVRLAKVLDLDVVRGSSPSRQELQDFWGVTPNVRVGPLATAQKPFFMSKDDVHLWLDDAHPDVLATDFEAYGFLGAIQTRQLSDALFVRGISDLIGAPAKKDGAVTAARNASAFAMEVLSRYAPARAALESSGLPAANVVRDRFFLQKVVVQNVRSLRSVVWQVSPEQATGWHVLIGNNGAGKSSMLRSIALALMPEDDARALRPDFRAWLRKDCEQGDIDVTVGRLGLGGNNGVAPGEPEAVQARLAFVRGSSEASEVGASAVHHEREGSAPPAFCVGYGPFRRFSGGDTDQARELAPYPQALRHLTLFSERAALPEGLAWLKYLDHRRHEKHPEGDLLDVLIEFINQPGFLPHGTRLTDVSSQAVTFTDGNGYAIDVEELSDGFRSVLSLTLDLLRQLAATVGPRAVFAPRDPTRVIASGIVLIDEVDAHLHPTWQREVGLWFHRHFPNVQFIVTSHSPLVCQAAEHGTVFLLPRPGTGDEGRMLSGVELDRVRYGNVLDAYGTGVFGQGVTRSETSKQMLRRLAALNQKELDTDLSPEEQAEQENLRRVLPTTAHAFDGANGTPGQ